MKTKVNFLYLVLISLVLQSNGIGATEHYVSNMCPARKYISDENMEKTQLVYMQLKTFILKCAEYRKQITNQQKAFGGILAIAGLVWQRDKVKALLAAMKYYIAFRGLEYGIVTIDRHLTGGQVGRSNLLFHTNNSGLEAGRNRLRKLPGYNYELNLNDVDLLSNKTFGQLIVSSDNSPYLLAKVDSVHSKSGQICYDYVDAKSFHSRQDRFLSEISCIGQTGTIGLRIQFPSENHRAPRMVGDVHYYELEKFTDGEFKYLGSLYDIRDNKNSEITEKLLNKFVANMSDQDLTRQLKQLDLRMQKFEQYFASDSNTQKNANIERVIILLKAIISRFDVSLNNNNNNISYDTYAYSSSSSGPNVTTHYIAIPNENVALAKLLLAQLYKAKGDIELARTTINSFTNLNFGVLARRINNFKNEIA